MGLCVHRTQELIPVLAARLSTALALQTRPVQDFGKVGPGVVASTFPQSRAALQALEKPCLHPKRE